MTNSRLLTSPVTRRQALVAGGLGTIGLSLPQLLRAERQTRTGGEKSVILVVPWGGPSQLDTFDPKPDAPSEIRSVFRPIKTRTVGLTMGEHLPRLAARSHRFAVVRSMSHSISTHNPATHYALTGHPPAVVNRELTTATRTDHPTMGSALAKLLPTRDGVPPYVQLPLPMIDNGAFSNGQNAGFLGTAFDPLVVTQDPTRGDFRVPGSNLPAGVGQDRSDARQDLLERLDAHAARMSDAAAVQNMSDCYTRAYNLLRSATSSRAFDLSQEPDQVRERYGRHKLGQSVLAARRLVEAGVRLILVADTTPNTNIRWDTHDGNNEAIALALRESDQALAALLEDLHQRGLLDSTIVAWMAEFGRTPRVKANGGRDHWPQCYSLLLAGGGIQGGQVHGSSDSQAAYPRENEVRPEDIHATIFQTLGLPAATELHDPLGRPHRLCVGRPIASLS